MAAVSNVSIGACSVVFAGVDLGHTIGGVEVSYAPTYKDVAVDKYGNTTVEKFLMGEKFTAKVKLAEYTMANAAVALPQASQQGATGGRDMIGRAAGRRATNATALLVLHPLRLGSTDRSQDVVMYKAYVGSTVLIPHNNTGEKVMEVLFEAILDETRADGQYLGLIGDSAN